MKKLIVIPTYNEVENISSLLDCVFGLDLGVHVLIVDDASPDGTGELAEKLREKYPDSLFVLHRAGKLGLGTAYITGFKWGLERGYDVLMSMDADFSHNPKYLPQIFDEIQKYPCVIGSRYVSGGGVQDWGLIRRMISLGGSIYARVVLFLPVHDLTGGFNCYRAENLKKINLDTITSKGYCFQIEMKFRHCLLGLKVHEVPIIFPDRKLGKSKMSGKIFKEAILNVLKLSFNRFKIKRMMKND